MSPDLEPQGTENLDPISLPAMPGNAAVSWVPTRRWLIEPVGTLPWSVEERQSPDGPSLLFMNDGVIVRVREYPSNWHDLPEAMLAELLRHPRGSATRA